MFYTFARSDASSLRPITSTLSPLAVDDDLIEIAKLTRREVERMVVAYNFDLRSNELTTELVPNPNAGREHVFKAHRMDGDPLTPVKLVERSREKAELAYHELFGGANYGGNDYGE